MIELRKYVLADGDERILGYCQDEFVEGNLNKLRLIESGYFYGVRMFPSKD